MPQGPAARITDLVAHPLPPILTQGPGSMNVNIGYLNAWRGIPKAAVAGLQAAQTSALATMAAAVGPAIPAAQAAAATAMSAAVLSASGGADIHQCATPLPAPPHGPGVVITGSITVQINYLPACRQTDMILEAIGPPNTITKGCINVIIGG